MVEFKVNEYITLKLENGKTNIYIYNREREKYELFNQCKYVLLRKTVYELEDFLENIESVDELTENIDNSLEDETEFVDIPPETQFWVHCSNMQVWAENNYDTKLIHSNLVFPLLKKLVEYGDHNAIKIFKEEISKRIKSGKKNVIYFLYDLGYIQLIDREEFWSGFSDECEILFRLEKKISQELPEKTYFKIFPNDEVTKFDPVVKRKNELWFKHENNKVKAVGCYNCEFTKDTWDWILNEISHLKHIRCLVINNSNFEEFPKNIGNFNSLKWLYLDNNHLKEIPFCKFKKLKHLSIRDDI